MAEVIRTCVIDDEPIACRRIQRLLKDDPQIEVLQVCSNGDEALESIRRLQPDLIFLDIQMPGKDGFTVLKSLPPEKIPRVIFVTAYDQYAIQAFEVHALDYLLKPFDKKRFHEALERAKIQVLQDRKKPDWVAFLQQLKTEYLERLVIKDHGRVYFLKTVEIDWIEGQGKYVLIHAGDRSHLIREGLNQLEEELDPKKFVRIHKSFIVNIDRIAYLEPLFHGDYRATLRNSTVLTVSRRYRSKLDHALGKAL